jgi:hypothetical protein
MAYSETPVVVEKKKKLIKLNFMEDFILSGVAAVTSKTISAPIGMDSFSFS